MSIFSDIASYFKNPQTTGGIVKNTITGLPKATFDYTKSFKPLAESTGDFFKDLASSAIRFGYSSAAGIAQTGGALATGGKTFKQAPELKLPGLEPIKTYQQIFAERQAGGESLFKNIAKTAGTVAIDEPVGFAAKPVFFAGGLVFKKLAGNAIEDTIKTIAKSDQAPVILKNLKKMVSGTDEELKPLAEQLTKVTKPEEVNSVIKSFSTTGSPLLQEARKYKSADEFVKAQPKANLQIINKDGNLAEIDRIDSSIKGGGTNSIGRYFENNPDVKTLVGSAEPASYGFWQKIGAKFDKPSAKGTPEELTGFTLNKNDFFNRSKYQTKSQLTDIWNKANAVSPTKGVADNILPSAQRNIPPTPQSLRGTAERFVQKGLPLTDTTIVREISQVDPVTKITEALTKAESLLPKQKALYAEERARRAGAIRAVGEKVSGEKGYYEQLGKLKGELPKVQFESIRNQVAQSDVDELFNMVRKNTVISEYEKISAQRALSKIIGAEGGMLPTKGEIELLREIFPKEFTDALLKKRPLMEKLWSGAGEVLNLPRAIMATLDLSAPLRQGVFLIGRPKQWIPAFKDMFKYAFSQKAYDGMLQQIKARPTYKLMRESNLAITDIASTELTKREEMFMSNLVEKIPIFGKLARGSNRAYSGFLTKLRADTFDSLLSSSRNLGIKDTRVVDDLSKFINSATGRGDLGKLNRAAVVLNSVFFSPRLMASRLNLLNPYYYYKLDPFVRKEALKSLFTFAGVATTVAGLAHLAGADITIDPRSSDFGKIKIGNTRYDPYGGFQQYIRLASQLVTGKIISSTTGREITLGEGYKSLTRKDIIMRFLESKEAPIISFATALMQGKTNIGEPVNVPTEVIGRLIPLVIQDAYTLYKENGIEGLGMAVPGLFGVGSQTYGTQELVTGKNKIGVETAQIRPVGGLAEDINKSLFGENVLGPSSSANVEAFYDQMKKMGAKKATEKFNEIKILNPELAKKVLEVERDRKLGITVRDKELKAMGVANGDRATEIVDRINNLKTAKEKKKLWEDLVRKKVITPEVSRQINIILEQNR